MINYVKLHIINKIIIGIIISRIVEVLFLFLYNRFLQSNIFNCDLLFILIKKKKENLFFYNFFFYIFIFL